MLCPTVPRYFLGATPTAVNDLHTPEGGPFPPSSGCSGRLPASLSWRVCIAHPRHVEHLSRTIASGPWLAPRARNSYGNVCPKWQPLHHFIAAQRQAPRALYIGCATPGTVCRGLGMQMVTQKSSWPLAPCQSCPRCTDAVLVLRWIPLDEWRVSTIHRYVAIRLSSCTPRCTVEVYTPALISSKSTIVQHAGRPSTLPQR